MATSFKSKIKDAVFTFLRFANPTLQNGANILMYHSVGTNRAFFTVSPYQFERQLSYLVENDYNIIKLSDLIEMVHEGGDLRKCVCITIDDGYLDNYTEVFPLLQKYNVQATIFIVTGLIGKEMTNSEKITLPLMTLNQMKEMRASGLVDFMPHTHTHPILNKISHEKACDEIVRSQTFLEDIFPGTADIFAYPKGIYTKEIVSFIKSRRFRAAVGVTEGLVHVDDNVYHLKRNSVDSSTTFAQFKGKVEAIDIYQKLKRR